jgi:hypothetical protein
MREKDLHFKVSTIKHVRNFILVIVTVKNGTQAKYGEKYEILI